MKFTITWLTICSAFFSVAVTAQTDLPFSLTLEPVIIKDMGGLQSFAWARSGDKIVLIGGRTDGLHKRQPFASFRPQYNNTDLIVIDIEKEKVWRKPVSGLPAPLAEQLQSTNMEFYQEGNDLLLIGGYGYSETKKDHITFPSLVRIKVAELINAIINGKEILPFIDQANDERMAVTGGRLNKLADKLYLVGGQRFDGRYNPHGPDHGPGFSQIYTNQIRKFSVAGGSGGLRIENYSVITDTSLLHRRDYNLLNQYNADGKEILTIYSGVFQTKKDIPYTTLVDITGEKHAEVPGFNQLYCHYHTASIPAYSKTNKTMYSIFLGGIAQNYKDSTGKTVADDNVPFVNSISVVERKENEIREYILAEPMPGYFGAAAEFIPVNEKLFSSNGILTIDKLEKKKTLIGYMIGGIDSRAPNVFWRNDPESSRASPVIWKVYFIVR
jgi:hypothetical protein